MCAVLAETGVGADRLVVVFVRHLAQFLILPCTPPYPGILESRLWRSQAGKVFNRKQLRIKVLIPFDLEGGGVTREYSHRDKLRCLGQVKSMEGRVDSSDCPVVGGLPPHLVLQYLQILLQLWPDVFFLFICNGFS